MKTGLELDEAWLELNDQSIALHRHERMWQGRFVARESGAFVLYARDKEGHLLRDATARMIHIWTDEAAFGGAKAHCRPTSRTYGFS